jgi:hypothetical protein
MTAPEAGWQRDLSGGSSIATGTELAGRRTSAPTGQARLTRTASKPHCSHRHGRRSAEGARSRQCQLVGRRNDWCRTMAQCRSCHRGHHWRGAMGISEARQTKLRESRHSSEPAVIGAPLRLPSQGALGAPILAVPVPTTSQGRSAQTRSRAGTLSALTSRRTLIHHSRAVRPTENQTAKPAAGATWTILSGSGTRGKTSSMSTARRSAPFTTC